MAPWLFGEVTNIDNKRSDRPDKCGCDCRWRYFGLALKNGGMVVGWGSEPDMA